MYAELPHGTMPFVIKFKHNILKQGVMIFNLKANNEP